MNISTVLRYFLVLLALGSSFMILSCDDDKSYDVVGDPSNIVYINMQEWSSINTPKNSLAFNVLHTPIGEVGKVSAKISVRSTKPMGKTVTVQAKLDNSLVETYNTTYKTSYATIPDGIVKVSNEMVSIAEGKFLSGDSVLISVDSAKLATLTEPVYLIPVRLVSTSDAKIKISSDYNTAYVLINRSVTNLYNSPVAADMTGTLLTGKTLWSASLNVAFSNAITRLLDGSTSTYCLISPAQPCALTVDMKNEYSGITGIRLHSYSTSYSITSANILTSNDGNEWTSQGTAALSISTAYQYVKFFAPVTVRYIKVDIKGYRSSTYLVLAEVDVYRTN